MKSVLSWCFNYWAEACHIWHGRIIIILVTGGWESSTFHYFMFHYSVLFTCPCIRYEWAMLVCPILRWDKTVSTLLLFFIWRVPLYSISHIFLSSWSWGNHLLCYCFLVASLICLSILVWSTALLRARLFSFIAASSATVSAFSFLTIPSCQGIQQKLIRCFASVWWIIILISLATGETPPKFYHHQRAQSCLLMQNSHEFPADHYRKNSVMILHIYGQLQVTSFMNKTLTARNTHTHTHRPLKKDKCNQCKSQDYHLRTGYK